MAFLNWNNGFVIGVQAMDVEHQEIVRLMNELHSHHEVGASRAVVSGSLDALVAYTVKHFEDEEAYMRRVKFSGYQVHRITHQHLLSKLGEFKSAYDSGSSDLDAKFFQFLKLWLSAHILRIDMKYAIEVAAA